jgi:ATP-dependent DNA helicase RecG
VLGARQSGTLGFRLADLSVHADLLPRAREEAANILRDDPDLRRERGAALRTLLYLFEREEAARLLRAG